MLIAGIVSCLASTMSVGGQNSVSNTPNVNSDIEHFTSLLSGVERLFALRNDLARIHLLLGCDLDCLSALPSPSNFRQLRGRLLIVIRTNMDILSDLSQLSVEMVSIFNQFLEAVSDVAGRHEVEP